MVLQYWVGDFFVDLSRNQVTQKEQSQTIAPKALAVLTYLAENQGRVVSYDELLSTVWPDTVVTPNTLQRSIAQLRKVLGQDNQLQSYIKTHAKQGYSLECDVKWHDKPASVLPKSIQETVVVDPIVTESNSDTATPNKPDKSDSPRLSKSTLRLISLVLGIIFLVIISNQYLAPKKISPLSFNKIHSLTATDDKEYAAVYSPDGQYVVFHRYIKKLCINNLWAKNIRTQQETQLTKNLGSYGSHSFSNDGKKLIFIATEDCDKPITQKNCYNLMSLDFEKALVNPQLSTLMVECKDSELRDPIWIDQDNIAVMQKSSSRWKLTNYSIKENKSTSLFELKEGSVIGFDYSSTEKLIAVTSVHDDGQYYIEMLKPDGEILSSYPIEFPEGFTKFRFVRANFDPLNKQLIFSSARHLFTLSYEGKVSRVNLSLDFKVEDPNFHPEGRRLLLIKKTYDSDIASIPLHQLAPDNSSQINTLPQQGHTQSNKNAIYPTVARSRVGEEHAIFQPNGDLIAFISERTGEDQLWTTNGSDSQLISTFPSNTLVRGIDWAADGKSILVNANGTLTQVFLDKRQQSSSFEPPVQRLFQWDSEKNTALLTTNITGVSKFVELNLTNVEYEVLTHKKVRWAQNSEDGRLIYTDYQNRFWQPGPAEDKLIESLEGQGSSKRFVIKDNIIYGINEENRLWLYDLNKDTFQILRELPENVDYLTDINQTHSLLELRITAKKEVIELTLSE